MAQMPYTMLFLSPIYPLDADQSQVIGTPAEANKPLRIGGQRVTVPV